MRRWTKQIRALELFGEKNRLGRGSNLGQAGGNLCLWGTERFFSIVRNAQYTYPLFERANQKNSARLREIIGDRVQISLWKRAAKKSCFLAVFPKKDRIIMVFISVNPCQSVKIWREGILKYNSVNDKPYTKGALYDYILYRSRRT